MTWYVIQRLEGEHTIRIMNATRDGAIATACTLLDLDNDVVRIYQDDQAAGEAIEADEIRRLHLEARARRLAGGSRGRFARSGRACWRWVMRRTYILYRSATDKRLPWPARLVALASVGYVFSPLDLIPDAIPVIGYFDDIAVVGVGFAIASRFLPAEVLAEYQEAVERRFSDRENPAPQRS
jgi:uncharacterized membrane protein YkvA (DUF1232 family)